jgi:hypothetical protein
MTRSVAIGLCICLAAVDSAVAQSAPRSCAERFDGPSDGRTDRRYIAWVPTYRRQ